MDLVNMIFSMGSIFIFGSWICEAGDDGKLQSRLLEDSDHHEDLSILVTTRDENDTDIFRPYSKPNSFRGVEICPYLSPDI